MPRPPTFARFASDFMANYAPVRYKITTVAQIESMLRIHLLPFLGERSLPDIGPFELQCYLADRKKVGLSPRTLRNHVVMLRQLFSVALLWGLIDADPTNGLQSPRQPRGDIPFLTPSQLRELVAATPADFRLITALAAFCGLRRGEVLSLRFDHVNTVERTLLIEHSKRGDAIHEPKSRASIATIPYPAFLAPMIEHRRSLVGDKSGLILCRKDGSPLADSFANRLLKSSLLRAGLPYVTYHQLRGSWVYGHMQAGTPVHVIQRLGRWESVETLLKSYGRWLPTAGGDAADALGALIGQIQE